MDMHEILREKMQTIESQQSTITSLRQELEGVRKDVQAIREQTKREDAEIAKSQCLGRQTSNDEGSTRWLEAGKCGRQSYEAIIASISRD